MDNMDESENNAKISDSAYSNSCSNSQSRRSSSHSGSHSSRSSGYGGKQSTCGSGNHPNPPIEKRIKPKHGKKKKLAENNLEKIQAGVEFRLPNRIIACQVKDEVSDVSPASPAVAENVAIVEDNKVADGKSGEDIASTSLSQSAVKIFMSKPISSVGFSCVISMQDGVVLYATSLAASLGYPKDMWIGRSFIDFIHPSDHSTFASQITSGYATPKKANGMVDAVQSSGNSTSTMFCRIRRYRGIASGFEVKDRALSFLPFMLKLSFRTVNDERGIFIYLFVQASPLFSAFKTANEIVTKPTPFVMRHVSNGNLEYIDDVSVPLLGYLPQDVTGKDVLRLYHPDDATYVRQLYETIVREGCAPRSKPYRLMAQNGHYLKLETEWSSFINPWSRKLEFVIGKHHVVEGPFNPDVFQPPLPDDTTDEEKNKRQGLRDSIVRIMNEALTKPAEIAKQQMTKRCQDLAHLIESLMSELPNTDDEIRLNLHHNSNYYERDSVMLGGISPHHDYNETKSSTTTTLSYNQLNFNENLQRYFNCHEEIPYTEYQDILKDSIKTKDQNTLNGGCMSPSAQLSGDSAELSSGESTVGAGGGGSSKLRLTESVLIKHNSAMEKSLVKRHRECRPSNKESREKVSYDKQKKKDHLARCNASFLPTLEAPSVADAKPHGLKRASKQLEAESRSHKQQCTSPRVPRQNTATVSAPAQPPISTAAPPQWQPSPAARNSYVPNVGMSLMNTVTALPGLIPMYYVPTTKVTIPATSGMRTEDTTTQFPVPHLLGSDASKATAAGDTDVKVETFSVQYMMYGQAVYGSPLLVSPINPQTAYPIQRTAPPYSASQNSVGVTISNYAESTEVLQNSNNSRDVKMKGVGTDEESSYSSFYSSFFKTESGSAEESGDAKKDKNDHNLESNGHGTDKIDKSSWRKREPPWMEQVCVTSELVYKYQVLTKDVSDVLMADKEKMMSFHQPPLVNEQLGQLYVDMELQGVATRLTLEEGITSSGSSGEENVVIASETVTKRTRRKREYNKLVMIYEDSAPVPPPCEETGEPEAGDPAPLV